MKRSPAVSGKFYQDTQQRLKEQVLQYLPADAQKEQVIGMVSPHAGLMYSGHVAGAVFSHIKPPRTFVMLGPNHTGLGTKASLMDDGSWEIPTGSFGIDRKLASKIALNSEKISRDSQAHIFEHSLEVQLPFIAEIAPEAKIVPVALLSATLEDCLQIGNAVAKAIQEVDYPVVILASSDMSHYLPDDQARRKDKKALDRVLALDPAGLYETVLKERISMCGYMPVTAMLQAALQLGADSAKLIKYATSGEVSGDYDSVVGYAGIIVR